jgi:hypothetical protein
LTNFFISNILSLRSFSVSAKKTRPSQSAGAEFREDV